MGDEKKAFADPSENWSNGVISSYEYGAMLEDLQEYKLIQEVNGHYEYTDAFFQALEEIVVRKRSINSAREAIIMRYCQAGVNTTATIEIVTSTELTKHTLNKQYDENTQKDVCTYANQVSNFIITGITMRLTPRTYQYKESSSSIKILDEADEDETIVDLKS